MDWGSLLPVFFHAPARFSRAVKAVKILKQDGDGVHKVNPILAADRQFPNIFGCRTLENCCQIVVAVFSTRSAYFAQHTLGTSLNCPRSLDKGQEASPALGLAFFVPHVFRVEFCGHEVDG